MYKTKRLRLIIIVYWFLLIYIVAALVWWFVSLQQQNHKMTDLLLNELSLSDPHYKQKEARILNDNRRKTAQYIGEGSTFLVLILIGAVFVYRATRRQLRLSMQQQNFMMAVTHELKTPIAVTKLNLETLQKRRFEEIQQQKIISTTISEVNRLNTLCNNILLASQLDAGQYQPTKTVVDISEVANRLIDEYRNRYTTRTFDASVQKGIMVRGEELLLEMLMSNLIENAVKYSPKNAPVEISLSNEKGHVCFRVADEGAGIAEDERSKIFEKFYRIGNEETRTAKGTGLGLFLCRQIAKQHNADISVASNKIRGSVFTVNFRT